jgi:hypothetical protein
MRVLCRMLVWLHWILEGKQPLPVDLALSVCYSFSAKLFLSRSTRRTDPCIGSIFLTAPATIHRSINPRLLSIKSQKAYIQHLFSNY